MERSLLRSAGRGALWQVLAGGWQAVVRLAASTVLARALMPSDFGLFGMALLVIELVDYLGGLAMTGGVIAKKEVGDKELSTCFWTMAVVRAVLFAIAFAGAPLAALLMKEPRVEGVVRAVSFTFLFSILGIMGNAILSKSLSFGRISAINACAIVLESSSAVFLAKTTTLGYWALVYPMLASNFVTNLSVFLASGWMPKLIFDRESFDFQFKFGIHGLGFNIANYLHQNLDYFLVGRMLGTTALGLYEYAYRIPHLVLDRLSRPVGSVVFPALATVQDDDEAIISGYIETTRYVTVMAFPALGGLAAIAQPLVRVLWGERWLSVVEPLQILCLCAAARCCVQPLGAVFLCKKRPEIQARQSLLACIATVVFVVTGALLYGVVGVAMGMLLSTSVYLYTVVTAFRLTAASPMRLPAALKASAISTVVSSCTAFVTCSAFAVTFDLRATLLLAIFAGGISYSASYYFLFRSDMTRMFQVAKTLVVERA